MVLLKPGADLTKILSMDGMVLKRALRADFGMYIPPLMEKLGLAEVTMIPKAIR